MQRKFFLILILIVVSTLNVFAQEKKKPLSFSVYDHWKYVEDRGISHDGEWVFYEVNPYKGDGELKLWKSEGTSKRTFSRGYNAAFSPSSEYLVFKIKPFRDTVRQKKLDKVPDKKLPKDSLGIYLFDAQKLVRKERVKSFRLPEKSSGWMAYQHEQLPEENDSTGKENSVEDKPDDIPETAELVVLHPGKDKEYRFNEISEYTISEEGNTVVFVKLSCDSLVQSTVYVFDTRKEQLDSIYRSEGLIKKATIDHAGDQAAFIHSKDTASPRVYSLYYWNSQEEQPQRIMDTLSKSAPENWTVGEHGEIYFSENDQRLYFGTAPKPLPEPEDTLLEEEKVKLDLWSWKDPLLQPQQLENLEEEKKRTYMAVYHVEENRVVQLADTIVRSVEPVLKGNGNVAIGTNRQPYQKRISWEMPPYKDVYLVNINNGERELIRREIQSRIDISTGGNYFYWYSYADSNWYAHDIAQDITRNLTGDLDVAFYNEDHDYPNDPYPYGTAGWTEDDGHLLIYDRYDIWKCDPTGKEDPVNLTKGYGREKHIRFRYRELEEEAQFIDPKKDLFLYAFNEDTKASGFFTAGIKGKNDPHKLVMEDCYFYTPEKARSDEQIIWRKSTFRQYPDLWYSNLEFEESQRISDANPQQKKYVWGDVEKVEWTAPNGKKAEGLLYKPDNFDPDKEYPMMVYFYRLSSNRMHRYYSPRPSRSVVNPTFYVSNGYLFFVPNIRYEIGYPGESAFNYVSSGTLSLINSRSYIDKNRIGLQGQSWGGYQVAHIITKTDMFAAASAGAPVSNMTSAYGGIRWGSGMSRMFQYEETQSRIGGTLWEKPLHYIRNSPVFYAPRVNTPLLIRHNDGDGAVPWYQGIEYFVALRRLQKPVWMLNYNGAPHNEKAKSPNCRDLSIRMKQFFDHYLKDAPAPVWMEEGIPAIKKGRTKGYELTK
jgi:dipeptidyl aminopeptidase/acylaminoacyl peptidase